MEAEGEVVDEVDVAELPKVGSKAASTGSLARTDPLELYMQEIQRHKLLTADEEHGLAVRYSKDGDVDAAARLVTANLSAVHPANSGCSIDARSAAIRPARRGDPSAAPR